MLQFVVYPEPLSPPAMLDDLDAMHADFLPERIAVQAEQIRRLDLVAATGIKGHGDQRRFDPVQHPLPDLAFPGWVRRLREPAYRSARRSRAG